MYNTILVPVENRESDQTILRHIRSLARLTHANLVLVHVADGWAARNFERFQLQESEEMKQDREYLARAGEIDADRSSLLRRPEMGGWEFIRARIRIGRGRIHLSKAIARRLRSRAPLHRFQYREHRCRPRALPYLVQPLRRDSRQV